MTQMAKLRKRYHYGRLHKRDDRDYPFTPVVTARVCRFWRQRRRAYQAGPSCVGFAWENWGLCAPIVNEFPGVLIYNLAKCFDEWPGFDYDGTSIRAGAKVLLHAGMISEYRFGWDLQDIIPTILVRGPVVFGTQWRSGMDQPDREGIIRAKGRVVEGHAYLVNGFDGRRGLLRIQNSWHRWGLCGRSVAFLPAEDAARLLASDGEACLAIETIPSS